MLRGSDLAPIPDADLREILPWIPPRVVCHVEAQSLTGTVARGVYIDSFIPPDRLAGAFALENLARVRQASQCAVDLRAGVVSLGGFSSILIEGDADRLPPHPHTAFTTGNTLTVAFIVQGVQLMCAREQRDLASSTLLVIGATGDVGSGCARYLAPHVRRILLQARNVARLQALASELEGDCEVAIVDDASVSTPADIVICAASLASSSLAPLGIAPGAIICDAGYPKNLARSAQVSETTTFFGGLGQVTGGMKLTPDLRGVLNDHPFPDVVHGCLLEGIALALERRFQPFSTGRGGISARRVDEMADIAHRHGIRLAPLYGSAGPLNATPDTAVEACP